MSTSLWIVLAAVAGSPGEPSGQGAPAQAETERPKEDRTYGEIRIALAEGLRLEASAEGDQRQAAARDLVALYEEVAGNERISNATKSRYLATIRTRLASIRNRLMRDARRRERAEPGGKAEVPAGVGQNGRAAVLAQQGLPAPGPQGAGGAGGGIRNDDYGDELVDLITKTIAPDSWQEAGGNGTIVYYRPLRVLVVRQTGEVHENLGGVLGQLHRAGP